MKINFLTVNNLTKIYDPGSSNEVVALDNLSLEINEGDFITIVGNNAAGKTTLFNLISGARFPTSGKIILDTRTISDLPEFKRAKYISCVRQNPNDSVITSMTLAENLAIAKLRGKNAKLQKGVKSEWRYEFTSMLKPFCLGLEKRLDDRMSVLSGGQKQIVALLMATIEKPKLLLLDEHTASLDPKTSKTVLEITDQVVNDKKVTTLMITHNVHQAIEHGNRLILLSEGKIKLDVKGKKKKSLNIFDIEKLLNNNYTN